MNNKKILKPDFGNHRLPANIEFDNGEPAAHIAAPEIYTDDIGIWMKESAITSERVLRTLEEMSIMEEAFGNKRLAR